MQFLADESGRGTGWNAGGAVTIHGAANTFNYSDGSGTALSPSISRDKRVVVTISMNTNGQTVVSAVYNGTTSSHTRSNTSLLSYAGSTGYPIGTMTGNGGSVPNSATSIRVYSVQIKKDSVLLFNAVPAIAVASILNDQGITVPSGTVGLFDKENSVFYTNRGSGQDFTPGQASI
jgi:hypothetical protein